MLNIGRVTKPMGKINGDTSDYNSNSYCITQYGFVFHLYLKKRFKDWFVFHKLEENPIKSNENNENPHEKK